MCGIAGFSLTSGRYLREAKIHGALDVLKGRGPEGTSWLGIAPDGTTIWNREENAQPDRALAFAFGCSRLAINDATDAGLQPISSPSGRYWVSMNGEVFNFVELRAELERSGIQFRTNTDTEVVAAAFELWGTKSFSRFNGQFAIAVLDLKTRKLFLVRDRIGIVPIFYFVQPGVLAFGSEIKALKQISHTSFAPNEEQLAARIGLPYKLHASGNNTLYEGVKSVNPGQYLCIDINSLIIKEEYYWRITDVRQRTYGGFAEAKSQLRALLIDSVKLRLRTDRKLAFIVSGGVDSTAVLGIARQEFGVDPVTFSLDLPDARFNENDSIREVLAWNDLEPNFIPVGAEKVASLISEVVDYSDEPLATPNAVLHGIMARAINSTGTKVVLNGVGGDEGFLGYHDHFLYHLYELKRSQNPRFLKEFDAWSEIQGRPKRLFDDFCSFIESDAASHSPDFLARSKGFDYRVLLRPELKTIARGNFLTFDHGGKDSRSKQMLDITRLTIPYSIRMDDNCYLSQAVEARQPFLDHRLLEFGLSMPTDYKFRSGVSKFILRQAVSRYIPSSRRRDVKKIGLNLPIDTWMRDELRFWVEGHLAAKSAPLYEFADYEAVQQIISEHQSNTANHSLKIWDLCCLNSWLSRL
jgi:asparagine synthase (glutamine-hydrolysing)